MIKLIQSSKLKLPIVYLVETRKDLLDLPLGIPFIRANMGEYNKCVQMMEWEVLWKTAKESGLKFNWEKILRKAGYRTWKYGIAKSSIPNVDLIGAETIEELGENEYNFGLDSLNADDFLNDISYKVDIDVIKELKLLPVWLEDIEAAVKTNITNSITYNPTLYTKKLGLPLGGIEYSPGMKNLIIIDISGSIPFGVSSTMLGFAKTLGEQFFADLIITGSISSFYEYEVLDTLDADKERRINGTNNDQIYFRKLVEQPRKYKTAIVFGDNDQPGYNWNGGQELSYSQGKEICKWEISEIISFHTHDHKSLAGYARWFDVPENKITHINNWVKDMNKN